MNERQISYFIAVAEEKNIGKASVRVPLSPSALARQIILLEEELGAKLFIRTRFGVELTTAGEVCLRHAYQLRAKFDQFGTDVRLAAKVKNSQINIGVVGSGRMGIPLQIIERFNLSCPNSKVVLHQITSRQQQIMALQQGNISAAFNCYFSCFPEIGLEVVCSEPLWVVLSQEHSLATKSVINLTELQGCQIIGARELREPPDAIERVFRRHDFKPSIEHRASELFSFLGMVACGLGVTLLPESLQKLNFPGVVFRPLLADFELVVNFECAYLKDASSPLLAALLDSVRAYRATGSGFLS